MKNHQSTRREGSPRWASEVSRVYVALLHDRWNLRRAARFAGDPNLKRSLRRLAFRRAHDTEELARSAPDDLPQTGDDRANPTATWNVRDENEVSTIAACARSNRRLRVAIERAMAAGPPHQVEKRLSTLRESANREAGRLEGRLRDIATHGFSNTTPSM